MKQQTESIFIREVSFVQVWRLLVSKLFYILLIGVILAVGVGVFTKFFVVPQYRTYTTMYVYANPESIQIGSINNNDLLAAENLAGTYKVILQSNQVLNSVKAHLDSEDTDNTIPSLSISDIDNMTNISIIDDTQLLKVEVISDDPILANMVAGAFAKVAPDEIVRVTKAGGVEIVDFPEVPDAPFAPQLVYNCVVAFIGGVIAAVIFFVAQMLLDTTIYTPDDVSQISDLPSLGTVPTIAESDKKSSWSFAVISADQT